MTPELRPRRRRLDAAGLAAVILAAALGLGWCASIIIAALPITHPITDAGAGLLNGIGQVLAGAIATYLGIKVGGDAERRDPS